MRVRRWPGATPRRAPPSASRTAAAGRLRPRRPPTGNGPVRETPRPARRCGDTRRKSSLSYRDIPERDKGGGQGNEIISTVSYRPVRNASGPSRVSPGLTRTRPAALRTQYAWFRSRFDEEPGRDEKSHHRDQRVRDTPPGKRRRPRNTAAGRADHEQVVFCQDHHTGLKAIIGIYSTALGPALGGTRFYPYGSEDEALADVLRLSAAMAYKNALAGLDHGGGKAVIIGDPAQIKTEPLLRAYGRFVASLGGRYVTACDVGTRSEDMDIIARECRWTYRPDHGQRRRGRLLRADRDGRHARDAGGGRARLGQHQPARPDGRRRGSGQGRAPPGRPPRRGRGRGGHLRCQPGRDRSRPRSSPGSPRGRGRRGADRGGTGHPGPVRAGRDADRAAW